MWVPLKVQVEASLQLWAESLPPPPPQVGEGAELSQDTDQSVRSQRRRAGRNPQGYSNERIMREDIRLHVTDRDSYSSLEKE